MPTINVAIILAPISITWGVRCCTGQAKNKQNKNSGVVGRGGGGGGGLGLLQVVVQFDTHDMKASRVEQSERLPGSICNAHLITRL